jgi:anti-sigma-K factor RskA
VNAYLAACARCRRRLDGFAATAQALPATVELVAPPTDLRDRFIKAAERRRLGLQEPAAPLRQAARTPAFAWRPILGSALGAAALAVVLLLTLQLPRASQRLQTAQATVAAQQEQVAQFQTATARNRAVAVAAFGNEDSLEGQLEPTELAPEAEGRILLSPGAPALALYARDLPVLPGGRTYQTWWVQNDQTISVDTFTPGPDGRAWRLVQPQASLAPPQRIFVTEEPAGGSPQPSDQVVLQVDF